MDSIQNVLTLIRSQKDEWSANITEGQKRLQELTDENVKLQQQLVALTGAVQACDVLIGKLEADSASE